jgi:hypothetical protein
MNNHIEWDVAEVLEYDYTYAYVFPDQGSSNINNLFALKVRSCSDPFNSKPYLVRPANNSIKHIPLIGELVLIFKTFNEQSSKSKRRESWYYVGSVDLQGSINENMIPGISGAKTQDEIDKTKPGRTFPRKAVSPLQPYEGDLLIEGRFGNSIRFSSTISTNPVQIASSISYPETPYYYLSQPWKISENSVDGDPIIILSNRKNNLTNKEFILEDVNTDASSLYLTSTQNVLINLSQPETQFNNFEGSQFIGVADKITLSAKTDVIVFDSKKAIVLNTPGDVRIGSSEADEPMVHGKVLESILQKIITHLLTTGIKCGNFDGGFTNDTLISQCQDLLVDLTSKNYRIKKT